MPIIWPNLSQGKSGLVQLQEIQTMLVKYYTNYSSIFV